MMKITLLLLLTLTGPFCTFTQASPTTPPTSLETTSEPKPSETSPPVASTQTPVSETTEKMPVMTAGVPAASTAPQVTQTEPAASTAAAAESTKAGTEVKNDTEATIGAATDHVVGTTDEDGKESPSPVNIVDEEGMGTGQVVGIVIGALIGVIVVIAIIILVVRRMGQYSP
ncbi:podoplanin precursor [Danio rerio]|nr:uncharacterized protein LOC564557 precursor [Danio rerio]|eukprot:NP_001119889.1 uncharacterized protein LOC564557 precursor [Danio rerio]